MGCAAAAIAAYGGALASVVSGYPHALDTACPSGAPAPVAFWPLIGVAVGLAGIAFRLRPKRRSPQGARSGTDAFALFVVIAVPLAALLTVLGYAFTYACWE